MPNESPTPIVLWSRHVLGKQCSPVKEFDGKLQELVDKLILTCRYANGLGLAAPQIGEFVQVAVINYPLETKPYPIINPVIDEIKSKGEQVDYEACLSLPTVARVNVRVRRCQELVFSYQDINGNRIESSASGMLARVIAHETDHLRGLFYIDRIGDLSRSLVLRSFKKYVERLRPEPNPSGNAAGGRIAG